MTVFNLSKQNRQSRSETNYFVYFATIAANLITFTLGSALTWSSPALLKLKEEDGPLQELLTPSQESWIASLVPLGAAITAPLGGFLSTKIGRKKSLILSSLPLLVGTLMTAFATEVYQIYIGRFLCGVSNGVGMIVIPLYVGEIAENENRGKLGCIFPVFHTVGTIFSLAVGPYVSVMTLGLTSSVPAILFLIVFPLLMPESPYYLLSQNDTKAAAKSLRKLRSYYDSEENKEFLEITEAVEKSSEEDIGIKQVANKGSIRSVVVTIGLVIFQQFTGINAILAYTQSIFNMTGSSVSPAISSVIIGIVQLFSCILALLLVDKVGRRLLLLLSSLGNTLSLFTLGLYFFLQNKDVNTDHFQWLPITSLIAFMIFYNIGLGPLPIAIAGEIFPCNTKSAASTLMCVTIFLTAFSTMKFFPPLVASFGIAFSIWLFTVMCLLCMFFVYFVVPETKGKSFQEIQNMLNE